MKIFKNILNIIYPPKCIFCQEIIPINQDDFICQDCYVDLDFIFDDKEPSLSVFKYNEKSKYAIHRFKYYNRKDYAKFFAKMMALKFNKINHLDYDFVVFVPMHKNKKKKRGYDQAELLAKEFSKLTNINFLGENIIRIKNTIPQSKVTFEERKTNVLNCFEVLNNSLFENKNILIVDDIFTSGNTIFQCIKEINKCNPKNISFFTLAKVINIHEE